MLGCVRRDCDTHVRRHLLGPGRLKSHDSDMRFGWEVKYTAPAVRLESSGPDVIDQSALRLFDPHPRTCLLQGLGDYQMASPCPPHPVSGTGPASSFPPTTSHNQVLVGERTEEKQCSRLSVTQSEQLVRANNERQVWVSEEARRSHARDEHSPARSTLVETKRPSAAPAP